MSVKYLRTLTLFLFLGSCVDRLSFHDIDLNSGIIVVDGMISDEPGPYTITVLRSSNVDDVLNRAFPAAVKNLEIVDDLGRSELLSNRGEGIFETNPNGIRGEVGRKYHIRLELPDGSLFESRPEELLPVPKVDSLYFVWESTPKLNGPPQTGFRVYMDSKSDENGAGYLRWRYTGTYMALTYPEMRLLDDKCTDAPPDPPTCSGYVWDGTRLYSDNETPCTCCLCWVDDNENKPKVSDDKIVTNGTYKRVEVGYVPFTNFTFAFGKYLLTVEQMSLSKDAFEFWKIIKDQKEGISSLFQPAFGKVRTNIFSTNSTREITGMFYAAAIKRKTRMITGSDAPISVPPIVVPQEEVCFLWKECDRVYLDASRTPPPGWE